MGQRSTSALTAVGLLALVPLLGGCALLFAGAPDGGSITGGAPSPIVVAASPVIASEPTPAGSPRALPAAEELATLLGPDDFTSLGIAGAGAPTVNGELGSVYAVYAGPSSAGGGIEMDVFVLGTPEDAGAMVYDPGMYALDAASKQQLGADRATFIGASPTNDGTATYDVIWAQKGRVVATIGIPTTATSFDQLQALAKLVLDRSAGYQ